ncbi:adhesin [Bacillus pumilus]|uniref:Adhesin n=1 Tax=Bacillus pumilus TaxID=1408 RepID=A0A2A5IVE0_BACPU|nr:adhesin [Bacillus pumilus]PCK21344.1 adhesin [Bacillus pumilus]
MEITNHAKSMLEKKMHEKNVNGIRFYFAGQGCCGPQFGISLDVPEQGDEVRVINGIQVAIDKRVTDMTEGITLDRQGNGLAITGGSDSSCC